LIGSILRSRYELTGLVADGPVFTTYSARDRQNGKDLAVRLLKSPFSRDVSFIDRIRETVAKYRPLQGGNVEAIYDVEQDDQNVFVVGELTRGPSLADRIRKLAPFSIQVSVSTGISLCSALEALHRSRVAHGDLNPQNVAVLADGDVRLQMTGMWEAYSGSTTAAAMVLPSMAPYLAPEISSGHMPSPRSDVYSIGIILFELLSGRLPYYADTPVAMALQHATSPTPTIRSINPSVPTVLDEIVKKAMSKDPGLRYANAGEMLADLKVLQDALRFGRQLSWPLRASASAATAAGATASPGPTSTTTRIKATPQTQRVAPRMSAIRGDEEEEDRPRRERVERDVPVWLLVLMTFMGAVALSLLGVWILFNLNKPRTVTVPNVKGLSFNEARAVLGDAKLKVRRAGTQPNDRIEMDHVIEVDPPVGEKTREGGIVALIVSSGSRYAAVPDLRGMTLDKAKTVLGSLNLELDENVKYENDPTIGEGLIIRSNPPAKARAERQTRVRVVVSSGKGSGEPAAPPTSTSSEFTFTLHLRLTDIVSPTQVRIDMTDDEGTTTIHDEEHQPGDRFDVPAKGKGPGATFKFFYDGELVKTVRTNDKGEQIEE
jgi:serine/threonine-protein kinase